MLFRASIGLASVASVPLALKVYAADANVKPIQETSQNIHKIRPKELPIYGEPAAPILQYIPEEDTAFRRNVSGVRKVVWKYLDSIQETTDKVKDKFGVARAHTEDLLHYIQEDSGALPRAAIITVAGLGGLVAGYRGGVMRKFVYASVGMVTAASICYPHQAVDITSGGWQQTKIKAKQYWKEQFPGSASKDTDIKKVVSSPAKTEEKKTGTKTQDKSESKKDYGQSKKEDKDLYTTRAS